MNERGYIALEVLLLFLLAGVMVSLGGMYTMSDRVFTAAINRTTASCLAQKEIVCLKSRVFQGDMATSTNILPQKCNGVLFYAKANVVSEGYDLYKLSVSVFWDEQGMKKEITLYTAVVANET